MKRKYYLRGLGIGILITALVFSFTGPKEMTDDEIIKRAEELGYVKEEADLEANINLKELLETGTPTPSTVPTIIATPEPSATEVPEETKAPTESLVPTETPTVLPTATPEPVKATATPMATPTQVPTIVPDTPTPQPTATSVPTKEPEEIIVAEISVERGNTATAVCRKIEAAGIVENGEALKEYLVQNQMTDFINIGVYALSSDMTFEEIANILTGR